MQKFPPSIFNDVIGPVMRGPSSSHVAGAARIADIVRQAAGGHLKRVVCDFDVNGSLAESHDGHGTDMGFICGLLGKRITDTNVADYWRLAGEAGLDVMFRILDYGAEHPNHYRIEAFGADGVSHRWDAISVGGGMIEMTSFDGFRISAAGDFDELLAVVEPGRADALGAIRAQFADADYMLTDENENGTLVELKFAAKPEENRASALKSTSGVRCVVAFDAVLPTHSYAGCKVPFLSAKELLEYASIDAREMWQLAALYESARGGDTEDAVFKKMYNIVSIMENCAEQGLCGTEYADRILGRQSDKIDAFAKRLVPCELLTTVIKYITAIMEVKSSMGVIVAAPTAGSCGCLPGTLLGAGKTMGLSKEEITKGMLAAGLIGVFIAESATFAAEVAGCQVECGAGSGMAAAGLTQMMGGSFRECLDAASMALQNITGLACDPVANRVEVPCLGKNVMGGSNAISSANMALAGYNSVIPLDQTIAAMYDIGHKLPLELRCTFGGLGKTQASLDIRKKLEQKK